MGDSMNLNRDSWNKNDIKEFNDYLKTFENPTKREWSTNLLRTSLPVLSMKSAELKEIAKQIFKGNYRSFLDLMIWDYYENTVINGFIINEIKDFDLKKKYLDIYSSKADNWATCDLLTFNIKNRESDYFNITLEYIKSDKPFVRRIGMYILFEYIDNENYINKIFDLLDKFKDEEDYYVNMMNAWLLCECYIKQKEKTLKYLSHNKLNKFTINKAIQKCRESRRVSDIEKDMLLKYKVK